VASPRPLCGSFPPPHEVILLPRVWVSSPPRLQKIKKNKKKKLGRNKNRGERKEKIKEKGKKEKEKKKNLIKLFFYYF
jgi:hypothetical protein